ncbi:MAG: adenylate/guanylate cyclase domain-containing protein [Candidatus Limnocylindrales bacterium]
MYPLQLPSGRHDPLLRVAAVVVWLLVCGMVVLSLGSWAARGFPPQPASWAHGAVGVSAIALVALVYATIAVAMVARSPRNLIGWVFLAIGAAMGLIIPLNQSLEGILHAVRPLPTVMLVLAWSSGAVLLPGTVVGAVLALLLFPSGRPEARHWRLAMAMGLAGFVLLTTSTALRPEGLLWYPTLPNPLGVPAAIGPFVLVGSALGVIGLVTSLALAAAWLAQRYRHAHAVQRRQLVWVALAGAAMTITVGTLFAARYVGTTSDPDGELLMLLAALGSVLFPLTLFRFVTVTASQGVELDDLTFLFTDLQDSTLMYERVGDATAYDLVRLHFRALEAVTRDHGGVIVKTIGDAIMARFLDPAQAVRTAITMRKRIDELARGGNAELVLRIGLHRGPAIAVAARDRIDYFGQTVNAAARIQAAAAPGEIVLSDDVYRGLEVPELLVGYDVVVERRKLRGVTSEMLLHRVAAPGVSGTATPARDELPMQQGIA